MTKKQPAKQDTIVINNDVIADWEIPPVQRAFKENQMTKHIDIAIHHGNKPMRLHRCKTGKTFLLDYESYCFFCSIPADEWDHVPTEKIDLAIGGLADG